jgi:hypothetical protein
MCQLETLDSEKPKEANKVFVFLNLKHKLSVKKGIGTGK